jgi:hypothetical protein
MGLDVPFEEHLGYLIIDKRSRKIIKYPKEHILLGFVASYMKWSVNKNKNKAEPAWLCPARHLGVPSYRFPLPWWLAALVAVAFLTSCALSSSLMGRTYCRWAIRVVDGPYIWVYVLMGRMC